MYLETFSSAHKRDETVLLHATIKRVNELINDWEADIVKIINNEAKKKGVSPKLLIFPLSDMFLYAISSHPKWQHIMLQTAQEVKETTLLSLHVHIEKNPFNSYFFCKIKG